MDNLHKILLIDLENCQGHIELLMDDLDKFSKVVICYAKTNAKIPLDWLVVLSQMLKNGRLEMLKMPEVGKDSADFGLSFLAGRLSVQLTESTEFCIFSDDKALDYVVHLLQHYGHQASRQSGKQTALLEMNAPRVPKPPHQTNPVSNKKTTAEQKKSISLYCRHLLARDQAKTAPKTKAALLQSAQSIVKSNELAAKIVHYLISSSTVSVLAKDQININVSKLTTLAQKAI